MTYLRQLLRHSRSPLVWAGALLTLSLLVFFRTFTEAEFALASAAIIPVYFVAWAGGFRHGLFAAMLAAMVWFVSGWLVSGRHGLNPLLFLNGATQFLIYLCVAALTARVRALLMHEAAVARRDALTRLLNRRAFHEIGHREVLRAARYRHPLAIAFIDLDRFKLLNDDCGHDVGDQALCAVARALTGALRSTDHGARPAGDEFGILLPELDRGGARAAEDKLAARMADALRFPPVTASIGIAWSEYASDCFETLLHEADALMYQAKLEGSGGINLHQYPPKRLTRGIELHSELEMAPEERIATSAHS